VLPAIFETKPGAGDKILDARLHRLSLVHRGPDRMSPRAAERDRALPGGFRDRPAGSLAAPVKGAACPPALTAAGAGLVNVLVAVVVIVVDAAKEVPSDAGELGGSIAQ
jgi:hypothetical protein